MTHTPHPTDALPLPDAVAYRVATSRKYKIPPHEVFETEDQADRYASSLGDMWFGTEKLVTMNQYRAARRESYELAKREALDALKFAYEALLNCSACAEPECKQDQQEFIGAALKKLEALAAQQSKEQP